MTFSICPTLALGALVVTASVDFFLLPSFSFFFLNFPVGSLSLRLGIHVGSGVDSRSTVPDSHSHVVLIHPDLSGSGVVASSLSGVGVVRLGVACPGVASSPWGGAGFAQPTLVPPVCSRLIRQVSVSRTQV